MSAAGSTSDPRCTDSMPPISTVWRLRRVQREPRYHAGVPLREIAEAIGRGLVLVVSKSPEEAASTLLGSGHKALWICFHFKACGDERCRIKLFDA
jgi:hypothetical protein